MDWFERLTGFCETDYLDTKAKLFVERGRLHSRVSSKSYGIGSLELVSLENLRDRAAAIRRPGRIKVSIVEGDARQLHRAPEYADALFQVASQFNLLEMISPDVTPESGVTGYEHDQTQGPACAIAAGAATVYRNYFVPVSGQEGQTSDLQLNALADLGNAFSLALSRPVGELWEMKNGYALCSKAGLRSIEDYLAGLASPDIDHLSGKLRIGLHQDVEVTDGPRLPGAKVSQAFCSALPVACSRLPQAAWTEFACFVLDAAYEATLLAGLCNAGRGRSNILLLTQLGGGAFGNHQDWIFSAVRKALMNASSFDLDVRLVSYGQPPQGLRQLVEEFE
jgi:hypothetical protein